MTSTITLLTSTGSVRLTGDNLVLDLRSVPASRVGGAPSAQGKTEPDGAREPAARSSDASAASIADQGRGNGTPLPVEAATEERTACEHRPDPFEKPAALQAPRPRQAETGEVPPHASPVILHRHQNINSAGATAEADAGGPVASADQSGAHLSVSLRPDGSRADENPVVHSKRVHDLTIPDCLRRRA